MEELHYRKEYLPYYKRILLLWGAFIVCLLFVTIITAWLGSLVGDRLTLIFISSAIQNVCVFILPALLTVYYITPQWPAFLGLKSVPRWEEVAFVVTMMIVSMPVLNYIIHLNESIDLPDSPIETWFRNTEAAARAVTDVLLGAESPGALVLSIAIAGVLTGFGEELFFRGAQQGIFLNRGINGHVAVWLTAVIFSALHFQFYGFVPRLLLGAFFGYLAWKGRSLWLPVLAHALNNTLAIVSGYIALHNPDMERIDTVGVPEPGGFPVVAVVSLCLTVAVACVWGRRLYARQSGGSFRGNVAAEGGALPHLVACQEIKNPSLAQETNSFT